MTKGEERLRFGTAGLRGPLGEGPMCMNAEIVHITATAMARWLPPSSKVIIGRDHRHGSEDFANVTARVLIEHGHRPAILAGTVPTPVVAHAVASTDAAAGVMVTASHNPAADNGYKVYVADGGQLLPGAADEIEALMSVMPWPDTVDTTLPHADERPWPVTTPASSGEQVVASYLAAAAQPGGSGSVRVAYSAMHGVGGELFRAVLERAGHEVFSVAEQHAPDPDFPTAAFPNPEEPGTLDLVIALAGEVDADVVLANDPDADRLAVAVKRQGGWERLTGDQVGVLLGWDILEHSPQPSTVATTVVSSTLLAKVAQAKGATCETTLTGFKYLARAGAADTPLVFAYEEALGYAVDPQTVRDKDGITAGLRFASLVARLKEAGRTVDDLLGDLYADFGTHVTGQVTNRFETPHPMDDMTALMAKLRAQPPRAIGGIEVSNVEDLAEGTSSLPPSDVLIFHAVGGRVIVRPSGTEPKIKAYLEAIDQDSARARRRLDHIRLGASALIA